MTRLVAAAIAWRFLHFTALTVLFGAALFRLHAVGKAPVPDASDTPAGDAATARAAFDRWLWGLSMIAATIALVSALGWLAAVAQDMTGSLAEALSIAGLANVLTGTEFGQVWAARIAVLAVLVAFLAVAGMTRRVARPSIAILAGIALVSLSAVGHGVSGSGAARAVHQAADAVHLFVVAAWLGGLVALLRVLTLTGPDAIALARRTLRRFSVIALGAAGLVVVTGVIDAAFLVDRPAALIATGYGRMLLAKATLVAGMIALGALNRFVLLPALDGADAGRGLAGLRQSVAAQIGLGCAAIAIVAVLGMLSPSR